MLTPFSPAEAERFRMYLRACAYGDPDRLRRLGFSDPSIPGRHGVPRPRRSGAEEPPLTLLTDAFLLGRAVSSAAARRVFSADFLALCGSHGLLEEDGPALRPTLRLSPLGDLLVASDHFSAAVGPDAATIVLPPNPPASYLLDFVVPCHAEAALDLGAGSGIVALSLAGQCDRVLATDINPRAGTYTAFNAALHGRRAIEFALGDRFAPAAGREFGLIVSNPPFLLIPPSGFLYGSTGSPLDEFCRGLVRSAPAHLVEGGLFQMIFEWVEIAGQPWPERLSSWFEGTGCDALLLSAFEETPERYAEARLCELPFLSDEEDDRRLSDWTAAYRAAGVTRMHGGLLALRRRVGRNWAKFTRLARRPEAPFGSAVLAAFAARDLLDAHPRDEDLLPLALRLAPGVRLAVDHAPGAGAWSVAGARLLALGPLTGDQPIAPDLAEFLAAFDGTRDVRALAAVLAARTGMPLERAVPELCALARRLLESGYLSLAA